MSSFLNLTLNIHPFLDHTLGLLLTLTSQQAVAGTKALGNMSEKVLKGKTIVLL